MKTYQWTVAGLLVGLCSITTACNGSGNGPSNAVIKSFQSEPGATQTVNDAAEWLLSSGGDKELTDLADQLMADYAGTAITLEPEEVIGGRLIPLNHIPNKFHDLGGDLLGDPILALRLNETDTPAELVLSWGNMRHSIIVYAESPSQAPEGFFVREVSDRIYVIANES